MQTIILSSDKFETSFIFEVRRWGRVLVTRQHAQEPTRSKVMLATQARSVYRACIRRGYVNLSLATK